MIVPDFQAAAELFLGSDWPSARAQGPRAFRTAANAIRFALEEAAPVSLHGARLQLSGSTYSGEEMRSLYRSPSYPIVRKHPIDALSSPSTQGSFSMSAFNYETMAELFPSRRYAKTRQTQYRRFSRAAEAIRYIMEDLPANGRAGSFLEVNETRFEGDAIRALYEAPEYPLRRQQAAA